MSADLREVLVKRPGPAFGRAFDDPAHGFLGPVDLAVAEREHAAFVEVLAGLGPTVHVLDHEPVTDPDLVYTFDPLLVTDRGAFDQIQQAGGFITVRPGSAPDANAIPVPKDDADLAMDAAQCIGCGACVAACKNASAMLFVSAKVSHLGLLPQGQAERDQRVLAMVSKMDELGFGNCTNQYECSAACPKLISHDFIARMNRDYIGATFRQAFRPKSNSTAGGA